MINKVFVILLLPSLLFCRGKVNYPVFPNGPTPWLTGPLIAPPARVIPLGDFDIEPYVFAVAYHGFYNSDWKLEERPTLWNNSLQLLTEIGIASWMDITIIPTVFWNNCQHQSSWAFGDLYVAVDIQLYDPPAYRWTPAIKLTLGETLPTGKYRNLDPKKKFTDDGGVGAWASHMGLVFGNIVHISGVHFFNYRLALRYILPSAEHLEGFNFWGGGYGTNAHFIAPQKFQADLGMELTLSQNWALGLDVIGFWAGRTHFKGEGGRDAKGAPAKLGRGSQAHFSLAPAIEYNWNIHWGLIAGSWFTVAGRETFAFASGVIALNYYK